MPFQMRTTPIDGLLVIEPKVFADERGFFMESFKASDFAAFGITQNFVQDNHSKSRKGVIRGLHFQRAPYAQGKLVRVTRGRAWDVAVDLRKGSPTFGTWCAVELSADNHLLFWIPEGFAHGFLALEDDTELLYKCTAEYNPTSDGGVRWNDPDIGVAWPQIGVSPLISSKDAVLPLLKDCTL
jgi:dTDP-4-dehydrorhamnose 3,5-epimerase